MMKITPAQHATIAKIVRKYDHIINQSPTVAALLDITREDRDVLAEFLKLKSKQQ